MDFYRELGLIEAYVQFARESLRDEHEGNFKYAVRQVLDHATALRAAVEDM